MRLIRWCVLVILLAVMRIGVAVSGEDTLLIYTWTDYIAPEAIARFEKEHNCSVVLDYFDFNEKMIEEIRAGAEYDLITSSAYMSAIMHDEKLLTPLDHSLLPNAKYLDKSVGKYTDDPDLAYSVPYSLSIVGIGYNTRLVHSDKIGSWGIFSEASLANRMTMFDEMQESLGAALKYLGYSYNSTDESELREAAEVLRDWKKNLAKFESHDAEYGLESGGLLVTHAYNGDIGVAMERNPDIGFYIPREGSSFVIDDFVIPSVTPHAELAHAFINHLLDPEIAAMNMEYTHFYMPNPEALKRIDPKLASNPSFDLRPESLTNSEVIRYLEGDNAKRQEIWDAIMADG